MVRVSSIAVAVVVALLGSCSDEKACTDIGCDNRATVTVRSPDGHWEDGTYALDVAFGDAHSACTFTMPNPLPPGYSLQPLDCTPALEAYVMAEVQCEEHTNGDNVSQVCTPIPDEYYLLAASEGTPETVGVTLQRGGDTLLDETQTISYQTSHPNGPECGPTCYGGLVELTLP